MACDNCKCNSTTKTEYNSVPPVHPNCRCEIEGDEWIMADDACEICRKVSAQWVRSRKFLAKTLHNDRKQVFGIASSTAEDLHDEYIGDATLENAAYNFVMHYRIGKAEHDGPPVATLIESFYITKDKAELLGIAEEFVGKYWVGFQINDDAVWQQVKAGKLGAFSIGGKARKA
jgi:hypothetical protein